MNDAFINAVNAQKTTNEWMDAITKNLTNIYTPGYREAQVNFKTFLDGSDIDEVGTKVGQGKAIPGTSNENIFLEGDGFFAMRDKEGHISYTRLGEFTFDKEGVYRAKNGKAVQGYILNDNGEVMASGVTLNNDPYTAGGKQGGPELFATTEIKLWIDPSNGKYLGKYDEFEFKGDGILYGKADDGKIKVPLYKVAIMNFNNPEGLYQVKDGEFVESEASGKAVMGKGEIRGGLIEMANTDFKGNVAYYQQAKMQLEFANKIISSNKSLLQSALQLISS